MIHTPNLSTKNFNIIVDFTGLPWIEGYNANDLCDCMHLLQPNNKYFEIFLPNSTVKNWDKEQFNHFFVTDENSSELLITTNINRVVKFFNNLNLK